MAIQGMDEQLSHAVGSLQVEMHSSHNTIVKYHSNSQQQCQLIKLTFQEVKVSIKFSNTQLQNHSTKMSALSNCIELLSESVSQMDTLLNKLESLIRMQQRFCKR
jgi:hypothetical protein